MHGVPIVMYSGTATTTGVISPLAGVDLSNAALLTPLVKCPSKFALQVTGLTAAGVIAAPTSWDVIVQPSLDGIAFNDMTTPMLEHVNTASGNGDVVWSGLANKPFLPIRFYKIDVKGLSLGATATKILITLLGIL